MTELLNRSLLTQSAPDPQRFVAMGEELGDCLFFTRSDPTFGVFDNVSSTLTKSIQGRTHYAPNLGDMSMRIAASDFERRILGLDYKSSETIITSGSSEAIATAILGVLNPGDEVIIPTPAVGLYATLVRLVGGVPVFMDTTKDSYQITSENLEGIITEKTKLLILNSPNNPTGVSLSKESLQTVHDAVAGKPIFVLCDDGYNKLVYNGPVSSFASFTDLKPQILVAQSLTQTFSMAGFRTGYLFGEQSIIEKLSLVHTALVHSPVNYSQPACIEAFAGDFKGNVDASEARWKLVCDRLATMGLEFVKPDGGYFVFPSIAKFGLDSVTFCTRLMQEQKLVVTPGICYGSDDHIRISYSFPGGMLKAGLVRLENFIKSL